MTSILFGAISGIGAGGILLFLSHVAPRFGAGNYLRDLDEMRLFGKQYSRRESHAIGILFHLLLSFFFGALYAFGIQEGVVRGYDVTGLGVYVLVQTLFIGGVMMPLEGHGLFGVKEDVWFPIDLLITNITWALLYGLLMTLWLPVVV